MVFMAGYGTLLLRESLGNTVNQDRAGQKRFIPVIVPGFKRLFNLIPDHYPVEDRLGLGQVEKGAANIEPAEDQHFNGLIFEVEAAELDLLDKRERYYKRIETPCFHFDDRQPMGNCHVYMSEPDARWIERDIKKLLPLWRDIAYARVGAYRISGSFGRMYDETTWLADGETLLVDFYRDYLDQLSRLA
jgi:hypothetical protein